MIIVGIVAFWAIVVVWLAYRAIVSWQSAGRTLDRLLEPYKPQHADTAGLAFAVAPYDAPNVGYPGSMTLADDQAAWVAELEARGIIGGWESGAMVDADKEERWPAHEGTYGLPPIDTAGAAGDLSSSPAPVGHPGAAPTPPGAAPARGPGADAFLPAPVTTAASHGAVSETPMAVSPDPGEDTLFRAAMAHWVVRDIQQRDAGAMIYMDRQREWAAAYLADLRERL